MLELAAFVFLVIVLGPIIAHYIEYAKDRKYMG
jgi:hypothetical protein